MTLTHEKQAELRQRRRAHLITPTDLSHEATRDIAGAMNERLMRPALIITSQPVGGHAAQLGQRFKDAAVEDLLAVSAVKAFDEVVLHRFSRLDEQELELVARCPFGERVTG